MNESQDAGWEALAEGPMHRIEIDRGQRLLDVRFSGAPTPIDVGWIAECVRQAARSFGDEAGAHRALFDCTGMGEIPAKTVDHVRKALTPERPRPLRAAKTAFVVQGVSARSQVERLSGAMPGMQMFDARDAALAWLTAD